MMGLDDIRIIVVCLFVLYLFAENQVVKRLLGKSVFFKFMRIFWTLMFAALLFFSCIGLFTLFDYARRLFETHELKISELSKLFPHFCIIVLSVCCWRYFWYYFRNDKDTILSGWYIKKHFGLNKRRRFDESYRCLQKASEIKPDSLQIWCLLASFAQLFLEKPEQADQYLAKARKILESKPIENPKEIAAVEFYFGFVSQYRDDHKTAIEHMKKAYELDPTPY
jgi:tetratricopeptide (TPR) repeat protein